MRFSLSDSDSQSLLNPKTQRLLRQSLRKSRLFIRSLFLKNIKTLGITKTFVSINAYIFSFIKDYLKKRSFFIVLIGPDGSGKTTIANELIDEIKAKKSCFTSARYLHGRFGILPSLSSFFGRKGRNVHEMKFDVEENKAIKPHSKLRISIYMMYYYFDYLFGQMVF